MKNKPKKDPDTLEEIVSDKNVSDYDDYDDDFYVHREQKPRPNYRDRYSKAFEYLRRIKSYNNEEE